MLERITRSTASPRTILIRLAVGLVVFFPEGIQKLIFSRGTGIGPVREDRHTFPELTGPFVGVVELVCAALIIVGLLTRVATIPLIVTMLVALVATKLPILLGHGFGPFSLPTSCATASGARSMRRARDLTILLGCLYLFVVGSGRWSLNPVLDRTVASKRSG